MNTCQIHNVPMNQMWKKSDPNHQGESWFSHKLQDGSWCNGKPAKPGASQLNRIEANQKIIIEMLTSIGGRTQPEPSRNNKSLPF